MTPMTDPTGAVRRSGLPMGEGELDRDLQRSLRLASYMRRGFYVVVLLVALAGQVSGAVEALGIPLLWAIPAVAALELGGIVVMANADVRRRLGERAIASRILSAAIAAGATAFNWLAHANHLLGGFFAGMSALGYFVWLMHTENSRRDRLRVKGDLPPTTPAYEVVGHWIRHPWLTLRAKSLAKANPHLSLYDSMSLARAEVRRERRTSAISKVLHRKIRAAVDPTTADIAVAVYDLDEIATRLANGADYDGLTKLIAADLAPERIANPNGATEPVAIDPTPAPQPPIRATAEIVQDEPARPVLPPAIRRQLEDQLTAARNAAEARAGSTESPVPTPRAKPVEQTEPLPPPQAKPAVEGSLRSRVHATLDAEVTDGDQRDPSELVALVARELQLDDVDRLSAVSYVRSWKKESGTRRGAPSARQLHNGSVPKR